MRARPLSMLRVVLVGALGCGGSGDTDASSVSGLVLWGRVCRAKTGESREYGLEWRSIPQHARERLRELASRSVRSSEDNAHPPDVT